MVGGAKKLDCHNSEVKHQSHLSTLYTYNYTWLMWNISIVFIQRQSKNTSDVTTA